MSHRNPDELYATTYQPSELEDLNIIGVVQLKPG